MASRGYPADPFKLDAAFLLEQQLAGKRYSHFLKGLWRNYSKSRGWHHQLDLRLFHVIYFIT